MKKYNILIAGYGNIGRYLENELIELEPAIYDPPRMYTNSIHSVYDIAFVCVPTDSNPDGSANISIVDEVVGKIQAEVIVIKSAIPVGISRALQAKHNKNIVVSPEYYGTTQHSSNSPDFLVLGGYPVDCAKVAQLYYQVKGGNFRIHFTDHHTAELAKYMENCFLALKVTFCNEFAEIAKQYGILYERLRECFVMDPRMGDSHTFVYEDQPYYDSHCLNKDVPALIAMAEDAPLISAMHRINQIKKERNND